MRPAQAWARCAAILTSNGASRQGGRRTGGQTDAILDSAARLAQTGRASGLCHLQHLPQENEAIAEAFTAHPDFQCRWMPAKLLDQLKVGRPPACAAVARLGSLFALVAPPPPDGRFLPPWDAQMVDPRARNPVCYLCCPWRRPFAGTLIPKMECRPLEFVGCPLRELFCVEEAV